MLEGKVRVHPVTVSRIVQMHGVWGLSSRRDKEIIRRIVTVRFIE